MSYLLDKLCGLFEMPLVMNMMVVGRKGDGSSLMLYKLSDQLPKKPLFGGFAHLAKLGLVATILHCVTVKTVQQMAQDRLLWRDKTCPAST